MKKNLIIFLLFVSSFINAQSSAVLYGNNSNAGNYASVNGIRIYYEEYGNGEPLLLLHGNWQSIHDFAQQIPELSKTYRVIAVDTRGHGKSSEDGRKFSYDLFATDMDAFLSYLRLDSVNIIGWSDGGNTGLIMAMQYPSKVKKLVTMGANIFTDTMAIYPYVLDIVKELKADFGAESGLRAKTRVRLLNMLLTEPHYSFTDLEKIRVPVLVMAGEHDAIREEHTRGIASHIPKGKLQIAAGESHDFPSENPSRFNAIVLRFLNEK